MHASGTVKKNIPAGMFAVGRLQLLWYGELLPVLFELVKGILIREGKGFPPAVVKWFMW